MGSSPSRVQDEVPGLSMQSKKHSTTAILDKPTCTERLFIKKKLIYETVRVMERSIGMAESLEEAADDLWKLAKKRL